MAVSGTNFQVGEAPQGAIPQPFLAPEHSAAPTAASGLNFNPANAGMSQGGSAVAANAGQVTQGGGILDALGLGGPLVNTAGSAEQLNPLGGKATGTNLQPGVTGAKGANDISAVDPRTWYPGIMTLFHSTRKPGGATSQ